MIHFENDYNQGCLPEIMIALQQMNDQKYSGYGKDEKTHFVQNKLALLIGCQQDHIFFLTTGTITNNLALAYLLKPWQGVITAETAHIRLKEAGALESLGHKIMGADHEDGKVTVESVKMVLAQYSGSEHMVQPAILAIAQPTEFGTIYNKKELVALSRLCKENNMLFYLDGARLGYALASPDNDVSLQDIYQLFDCFYIGGNKCGALFGEALVFGDCVDVGHFRHYMKQHGALLSKSWILATQFEALFSNNLMLNNCKKANEMMRQIADAFEQKGCKSIIPCQSNQLFVEMSPAFFEKLSKNVAIKKWDEDSKNKNIVVRIVTSWSTKPEEVDLLTAAIKA